MSLLLHEVVLMKVPTAAPLSLPSKNRLRLTHVGRSDGDGLRRAAASWRQLVECSSTDHIDDAGTGVRKTGRASFAIAAEQATTI